MSSNERHHRELANLRATSKILLQERKLAEVFTLFDKCLSTRRLELGDENVHTVELIVTYAKMLGKQKQKKHLKAARKLYEEALDYFKARSEGEYELTFLRLQHSYSSLLSKLEAYKEAKNILKSLLEKFYILYENDEDHECVLNTSNQLGSVLKKIGNLRAAKVYYEKAYLGNISAFTFETHSLFNLFCMLDQALPGTRGTLGRFTRRQ